MVQIFLVNQIQKSMFSDVFKILNQGCVPADGRVWIYMAVQDVRLWLKLQVLPTPPSFHLMMAFSVLGIRQFTIQAQLFEHRLTSEVLGGADSSTDVEPSDS